MQSFRRYPFKRPSKKRRGVKNCKCKVKFKAAHRSTRTVAIFPSSWSEDRFFLFFCILRALLHKNCCNLLKFVATSGRLVTERTKPHRNRDATTKGKVFWKCAAKFQPHLRGNILSVSSLEGNTLSVKKIWNAYIFIPRCILLKDEWTKKIWMKLWFALQRGSCPDVKTSSVSVCFAEGLMNVLLFIEGNSRGQHMTNILGGSCPDVKIQWVKV